MYLHTCLVSSTAMNSLICHVFLQLICSTPYLLLFLQTQVIMALAHQYHNHHLFEIPTNVTKHLHFPNFNPNLNPNPTTNHIKLLGSASISLDKGSIQIPNPSPATDQAYQVGRAIFSSPIRLFDPETVTSASFNTTFSFHITTRGRTTQGGGDGLAFVIVPDEFTVGRPGPWLGILNDACDNHYKAFAIEFDTVKSHEVGDPTDDHVGINLGSIVPFKVANLPEQRVNISLHDHRLVRHAWIMYNGDQRWITVYLGLDGDPIPQNPILSSSLNLAPFLQEYMFVGFSASTSNSTQIHSILSWEFSCTVQGLLRVPSRHSCDRNVDHQVDVSYSNRPSSFLIFVCIVGLFGVALIIYYCNGKSSQSESSLAFMFVDRKRRPTPPREARRFTFLELYKATRSFSEKEVLGWGSRGASFRGTLPNQCQVTAKRFSSPEFLYANRVDCSRILKRISSINSNSHPNLASIRGWCCENREIIIVYDYFPNGTIDRWLVGPGVLPWTRRFKLIKNVAEALSFLHSKGLAHGNLRISGVFLDVNYGAILGDYGFVLDSVSSKQPDDVLDFGMLVLEIVAGKSRMGEEEEEEEGEMGLLGFAWRLHERGDQKAKMVDGRMGVCVDLENAVKVLEIGLLCTLNEKKGRPTMEEVVQFLNMNKQIPQLPPNQPNELLPKTVNTG